MPKKESDRMAIGYDPKIGDYSNEIYSMGLETSPQMKATKDKYRVAQIKGDTAGMQAAHDEAQALRLSAGYTADAAGSNFSYVEQTTPTIGGNATQAPVTDPYAEMLTQYQAEQRALAEAQRQSRIAGLGKARDSALSGLDSEKGTIDPYYYDKRNEAAGASDVGAMNFAQFMAGRGIKGSAGAMPEMYRNAGLQSQIGRLDTQQAAEHSDIARRRSGIESAYQADVAGASADIDAQTMQNYINQMQTVQAQRIADMAAQGMTSTGQPTLQGKNAQNSEYERQAALLAARYYDDIQAKIDELATANPNDPLIPYLYSARREKIQSQAEQKAAAMAAASEAEQVEWDKAFKLFERTGGITSAEQAQILGLPQNATAADVDIARMNAQTSRINATKTPTVKPASYDYNTDPSFQGDVSDIMNGLATLADIQSNAAELQAAYGYDGYMQLVKLATPKE